MASKNFGSLADHLGASLDMEGIPLKCKLDDGGNIESCSRVRRNTPTRNLGKNEVFVFAHAKSPGRVAAGKTAASRIAPYKRAKDGDLPAAGAAAARRAAARAGHQGSIQSPAQLRAKGKDLSAKYGAKTKAIAKSCAGLGKGKDGYIACVRKKWAEEKAKKAGKKAK